MKRSSGLQRHVPLVGDLATHRAWQRRSQQAAIQRAQQAPKRRPVHTPAAVVDLIIARSIRAFGADPDDYPRGLCELCGAPATNTQTRRPDGMGGTSRPETYRASNKVRVCGHGNWSGCHALIELNRTWALEHGLLVPQAMDPAGRSVHLGYGRVLLDDKGGYEPADTNTQPRGTAA